MILYIVTDSDENARGAGFYRVKFTLEEYAKDPCAVLHYRQVTPELIAELRPWAICHSGCSTEFKEYDVLQCEPYHRVITDSGVAQIGFCGGHQIIAHVFGGALDYMRKVGPDEADHNPGYHAGQFKEWGVYPVRIVARDPLFEGLGDVLRVPEYHMNEVKELPDCLRLLASTKDCRVQAYVHTSKPIYGTQFHPEQAMESYPDGFQVLRNFFALARQHAATT